MPKSRAVEAVENTIGLVAEEVRVAKRKTVRGRVDVRTVTETNDEVVTATLKDDKIEVTRVPVNQHVDVAPKIRTEGDLTIVPVLEEVLVVEKRLLLKEEIHIRRITRLEDVTTTVPLRRQRAVVERNNAGQTPLETSVPKETST